MDRKFVILAVIGAGVLCCDAHAQPAPPSTNAIPGKSATGVDAPNTDLSKQSGPLSDKLNRSDGVIHPDAAVDPAMQKPAPATGAMPVIPPPGSPGGPTDVQPK
jgi:hypothetical protein